MSINKNKYNFLYNNFNMQCNFEEKVLESHFLTYLRIIDLD